MRHKMLIIYIVILGICCLPNILGYVNDELEKYSPPLICGVLLSLLIIECALIFKPILILRNIDNEKNKTLVIDFLSTKKTNMYINTGITFLICMLLYGIWLVRILI